MRALDRLTVSVLAVAFVLAVPSPAGAAPPANDDFADAHLLLGLSASAGGSNVGARASPASPRTPVPARGRRSGTAGSRRST
jgi:hypothetical protein